MHDFRHPMGDGGRVSGKKARIEALHAARRCDRTRDQVQRGKVRRHLASPNGFQLPSNFALTPSVGLPMQRPVSSQASRIAELASARAYAPAKSSGFLGRPGEVRARQGSARQPPPCCPSDRRGHRKHHAPGMNTTLSCRLPTRTFGFASGPVDQDQRRCILRPNRWMLGGVFPIISRIGQFRALRGRFGHSPLKFACLSSPLRADR